MPAYNPIIRTFCRVRTALARGTGIPRHQIRPGTPLESLLPRPCRRRVWRELRAHGLPVPRLELPAWAGLTSCLGGLVFAAVLAVGVHSFAGLLAALPVRTLLYLVTRPWAVEIPIPPRTVGELALYLTRGDEHRGSGYRWTPDEIALKVRMTLAESLNADLAAVRLETRVRDLL